MSTIHDRIDDLRSEFRKPEPSTEALQKLWKEFEIDWWYFCRDLENDYPEDGEGDEDSA